MDGVSLWPFMGVAKLSKQAIQPPWLPPPSKKGHRLRRQPGGPRDLCSGRPAVLEWDSLKDWGRSHVAL